MSSNGTATRSDRCRPRAADLLVLSLAVGALTLLPSIPVGGQDLDLLVEDDALASTAEPQLDPSIWILDIDVLQVRTITLLEGPYRGEVYWYVIYRVENESQEERPAFLAVTATAESKKTYSDVPIPEVEQAIERRYGKPLWGFSDRLAEQEGRSPDDANYLYTTFKPGEKRLCVAVMNRLDPRSNRLAIRVRGLSNDLELQSRLDGSQFITERVFELEYHRPGDEYQISFDEFILKRKAWTKIQTELVIPAGAG